MLEFHTSASCNNCEKWVDYDKGQFLCPHCHNKYKSILGKRADRGSAWGTCSVDGCENEADYYVDFNEKEVGFGATDNA